MGGGDGGGGAVAGMAAMEMVVAVRMVKDEVLTRWKCRMPNTK